MRPFSWSKQSTCWLHKAHQPDVLADFANADPLTGEHSTEVDLFACRCRRSAWPGQWPS